ncbi:MAG: hypothetical protein V3V10_01320 [Planctomycetota bacterium]
MTKPLKETDWFAVGNSGEPYPSKMAPMTNGVYGIRSKKSKQVLYIGESHTERLLRTLTRHLQDWNGPTAGPSYERSSVEVAWKVSKDPLKAEAKLIGHYDPPDNTDKPRDYLPLFKSPKAIKQFESNLNEYEDNPFAFNEVAELKVFNDDIPF